MLYANSKVQAFADYIPNYATRIAGAGRANVELENRISFSFWPLLNSYRNCCYFFDTSHPKFAVLAELSARAFSSGNVGRHDPSELTELQITTEIFYDAFLMNASILADQIAEFLWRHYGDVRGVKAPKRHRLLCENIDAYSVGLGLILPDGFRDSVKIIEDRICEFRDRYIVHAYHLRRHRILSWKNDGTDVSFTFGMLYPTPDDDAYISVQSIGWVEAKGILDSYIDAFLILLDQNIEKRKAIA